MEAYEYIRKVKGILQTESITDLSYSLSIEEVIELMDGYKAVKNNVGLANVVGRSEQLNKMLQYLSDEDELVGNRTHQEIIDSFTQLG